MINGPRSFTTVLAVAIAASSAACADAKHVDVRSPSQAIAPSPRTGDAPRTAAVDAHALDNVAGTVSISEEIRRSCGIADAEAFFAVDSSRLRSADVTPLNQVAACFTTGPLRGRTVRLVGHADPRGPTDYNMLLGHARADAVGSYLDARGMARSKTESTSRGAIDATGTGEPGWAKDRRVDVLLGS